MDEELKKLLTKNLEVSEKTLAVVKKLRRDQWYNRVISTVKWLAILGVIAWAYTQAQPFINDLLGILDTIQGVSSVVPKF